MTESPHPAPATGLCGAKGSPGPEAALSLTLGWTTCEPNGEEGSDNVWRKVRRGLRKPEAASLRGQPAFSPQVQRTAGAGQHS